MKNTKEKVLEEMLKRAENEVLQLRIRNAELEEQLKELKEKTGPKKKALIDEFYKKFVLTGILPKDDFDRLVPVQD